MSSGALREGKGHFDKRGGASTRGRLAWPIDAGLARPPHTSEDEFGLLRNPKDLEKLADCVELARRMRQPSPSRTILTRKYAGPKVRSREEIKSFLREQVQTYIGHMTSSAPMGPDDDPRAVVDENGKVRRVEGLYAGDASIMPDVPSVATNPTVILMAEIVADRIKAVKLE